jgi:hypothetical protein
MVDIGGNLGPEAPTLAYEIRDLGQGPVVAWSPIPVDITAEQALAAEIEAFEARRREHDAPERREAESWLREILASGPVSAKDIEAAAKAGGISIRTLKRAKNDMGVESVKQGFGKDSVFLWRLPESCTGDQEFSYEGHTYP